MSSNIQVLRDRNGNRIAEIEIDRNGYHILRELSGRRLGEYDPHTNVTKDVNGRRIGEGNLLATLLHSF